MKRKLKGVNKNSFYRRAQSSLESYNGMNIYPKERNIDTSIDLFDYKISEQNVIKIIKK